MATILDEIVEHQLTVIETAKRDLPFDALVDQLADAPPVRDFVAALKSPGISLIAEVKKKSPSGGEIRMGCDPVEVAKIYEQHGAACVSCLTELKYFGGTLADLQAIRSAISLPVLRKDFIVDRYQVAEARAAGADCILLIAECLQAHQMRELFEYAYELGMHCLVELYDPNNLQAVIELNPPLVGVNNRNLKTMVTDVEYSISVLKQLPQDCVLVSESGIRTRDDVIRLERSGVHAMLVGESLTRSPDIGAKVDELLGIDI